MKTIKILYKIIIVTLLIMTYTSCVCCATDVEDSQVGGNGTSSGIESTTSSDIGLPNLEGNYRPTVQMGQSSINIVSTILSILTAVGIVIAVVGIALIGFNSILGSASEKAAGQEKYVGIVIASLLITGGSIIAKFIINFAENLV